MGPGRPHLAGTILISAKLLKHLLVGIEQSQITMELRKGQCERELDFSLLQAACGGAADCQ